MESTCATTQEAAFYDGVLAYPLKVTGILQTDAYTLLRNSRSQTTLNGCATHRTDDVLVVSIIIQGCVFHLFQHREVEYAVLVINNPCFKYIAAAVGSQEMT